MVQNEQPHNCTEQVAESSRSRHVHFDVPCLHGLRLRATDLAESYSSSKTLQKIGRIQRCDIVRLRGQPDLYARLRQNAMHPPLNKETFNSKRGRHGAPKGDVTRTPPNSLRFAGGQGVCLQRSDMHKHTHTHMRTNACEAESTHVHKHVRSFTHTHTHKVTTYPLQNVRPTAVCRQGRALLAKYTCTPTSTREHKHSPHTLHQTFVLPQCAGGVVHSWQSTPAHPHLQECTQSHHIQCCCSCEPHHMFENNHSVTLRTQGISKMTT